MIQSQIKYFFKCNKNNTQKGERQWPVLNSLHTILFIFICNIEKV